MRVNDPNPHDDDESRLLKAILANPDDDATRLVYADSLQHRHDPRGELIVVQCALAGLNITPRPTRTAWVSNALVADAIADSEEIRRLRLREAALLKKHGRDWIKDAVKIGGGPATEYRLARGFLEHVYLKLTDDAPERIEHLFDAAPHATSLALFRDDASPPGIEQLASMFRSHVFKRLRALSCGQAFLRSGDGIGIALEGLRASSLRHFECELSGSITREVRALTNASFYAKLDSLDLGSSRLGDSFPRVYPPRLSELHLDDCDLRPSAAHVLAQRQELAGLKVLGLRKNDLLGDVTALTRSNSFESLRALDIGRNGLTTANAITMLSSEAFPELRLLKLSHIKRGLWDPHALAKLNGHPHLTELHLEATSLDDDAIAALVRSPLLARLHVLNLAGNVFTDKGARAIAESDHCTTLRMIDITQTNVTSVGKKLLAESPHLAHARVAKSL